MRVASRRKQVAWIGVTALALSGGGIAAFLLATVFRSADHFRAYHGDTRVRYELGAEAVAAIIARALPQSLASVEATHGRPFAKPVTIHVCASTGSFDRYGFGVGGAGGFLLNNRLFISPKPQNTAERLPRLLTHELSHLHLEQQLGALQFARRVPAWFSEGLAVYVSGGGGAESVSERDARSAIAEGRVFRRDATGSLFFRQTSARDGLTAHLFYRESALFIAFLAGGNPSAFAQLLHAVQDGKHLSPAFEAAYGRDIGALWRDFCRENDAAP
jgi:hypothetical protein